jgi:hypothetical protein
MYLMLVANTFLEGRKFTAVLVSETIVLNRDTERGITLIQFIQNLNLGYQVHTSSYPWFTSLSRARALGAILIQEAKATKLIVEVEQLRREVNNGCLYDFSQKGNRFHCLT